MPNVTVEYFAILREQAGQDAERVSTTSESAAGLFEELRERYGFPRIDRIKLAINDEFAEWDTALHDGDTVVFIPPVAGG